MNGLSRRRPQDLGLGSAPSISRPKHHPIFPAPRLAADGIWASQTDHLSGCPASEAAS